MRTPLCRGFRTRIPRGRYSLYLLYWNENTSTDAETYVRHFTCFTTSTKVQVLTQLLQSIATKIMNAVSDPLLPYYEIEEAFNTVRASLQAR